MKKKLFENVSGNQFKVVNEGMNDYLRSHGEKPISPHGGHAQAYLDATDGYADANNRAWEDEKKRKSGKGPVSITVNKSVKNKKSFVEFLQLLVKSSDIGNINVTFSIDDDIYTITKNSIYQAGR